MLARLGFVAAVLSEDLSTSRTCRLRNASRARLRALTEANLQALEQVLSFLERQRIQLYRISSNLIPFASHPVNTIAWWDEYAGTFRRIGARLRRLGIRVSTHPGQYTVLNSPRGTIVRAAVGELVYHAQLLDALQTDASSKIVLHLGGLYGGTERAAMERFTAVAKTLPHAVLRRLVVENDDRLFDAEEVLAVGRALGVPVVFDWLHHRANPCSQPIERVLPEIFDTWRVRDGTPKIHLSSQAPGGPVGAHADYVKSKDLLAFLKVAPLRPFDCMLEAKQKDRALLRLRAALERRGIVESHLRACPEAAPAEQAQR